MDAFLLAGAPCSGIDNMALDEAILQYVAKHPAIILRIYRWAEPTLSLGYFQKLGDRQQHLESAGLNVVRRATGGGAIVHHHDLTYSLALNDEALQRLEAKVPIDSDSLRLGKLTSIGASTRLYNALHSGVTDLLEQHGYAASVVGSSS